MPELNVADLGTYTGEIPAKEDFKFKYVGKADNIRNVPIYSEIELTDDQVQAYTDRGTEYYGSLLRGIYLLADDDPEFVNVIYDFQHIKFDRIRRITGYLVGTLDRFNDAKRSEEHDRVKHQVSMEK